MSRKKKSEAHTCISWPVANDREPGTVREERGSASVQCFGRTVLGVRKKQGMDTSHVPGTDYTAYSVLCQPGFDSEDAQISHHVECRINHSICHSCSLSVGTSRPEQGGYTGVTRICRRRK